MGQPKREDTWNSVYFSGKLKSIGDEPFYTSFKGYGQSTVWDNNVSKVV